MVTLRRNRPSRSRIRRLLRSRLVAVVAGLAMMIAGYIIAAPYPRTLVIGILTSLWLLPASFYLGSNIRYHQRATGSAPDPAVALLETIRRDHPEV